MRAPVNRTTPSAELQMTPMIDVVFLLLIFFLWTSSFEKPEGEMASGLAIVATGSAAPAMEVTPEQPLDELVITLTADSPSSVTITMNDQPLSGRAELKTRLAQIVAIGAQPPVIVVPRPEVTMGDAIAIYDVAVSSGLERVLFSAPE
jgi:biopolymer transport protein ExbD